jgi:acyl-CoA thioester hydrolase
VRILDARYRNIRNGLTDGGGGRTTGGSGRGSAGVVVQRRVEWADTDGAGHQHFTAVLRWLEEAETCLHERLGIIDRTWGHIPRVHLEVDFTARLYFRDMIDVELWVLEVGRSSARYGFSVRRGRDVAARGSMVVVNCDSDPARGLPREWPEDVRAALTTGGAQLPEFLGASPTTPTPPAAT